ncbi:MAG TPA: NrsF family protein [Steroidobacteraceae bacterium]|nr:NrsF family protein [Steroidobacteraceae bacterium]
MKDEDIERVLGKAKPAPSELDEALRARIAASIPTPLQPVRPLPRTWILTSGLVLICAAVGLAGAARAGFYGIEKLGPWAALPVLAALGLLAWLAGEKLVAEMIPGRVHALSPGGLLLIMSAVLLAVFAFSFTDYHTDHFLSAGLTCLLTGVLHAIPAAVLVCSLLRRGFAVSSISAGLVAGALAGLAGVTMLELHCSNFQALHVLVWHTAVVPVSAAVGAAVGWALRIGPGARSRTRSRVS